MTQATMQTFDAVGVAALRERVRRERARRYLVDFSEYVFPWYRAAAHHRYVAGLLEQVYRYIETEGAEGIGRLLIFEPPRHGKTQQASILFPAWVMGRLPNTRLILTGYNGDRANENSRAVREIVKDANYGKIFGALSGLEQPVELSPDSRSVQSWELASPHRGGMIAAGVQGGITGKGAHLFIVDDPFRGREDAESISARDKVWDWWSAVAYTRFEKGAAVLGILTRWHPDDWAGRLLKLMASSEDAERWHVVNLPAIWESPVVPDDMSWGEYRQEKLLSGVWLDQDDQIGRQSGQALWPEKYDEAALSGKRHNMKPYDWAALYQQQPYFQSGEMFRREWFAVVDTPPKPETITRRVRYWDKAGNQSGIGGDYACGVLMCVTREKRFYVEHVTRRQCTPAQREQEILQIAAIDAKRDGPRTETWHQQDTGTTGLESAQGTNRRLARAGHFGRFERVTGNKKHRAGEWSTELMGGGVYLLRGAWNYEFVEEHMAFPVGTHDDQVDAASSAYNELSGGLDPSGLVSFV